MKPVETESYGTREKYICFKQVSVLAGVVAQYSFHQDREILLFKTGLHYRQVRFSQVLLFNHMVT